MGRLAGDTGLDEIHGYGMVGSANTIGEFRGTWVELSFGYKTSMLFWVVNPN